MDLNLNSMEERTEVTIIELRAIRKCKIFICTLCCYSPTINNELMEELMKELRKLI